MVDTVGVKGGPVKFIPDYDAERAMLDLEFAWEVNDKYPLLKINLVKSARYNPRFTELNTTKVDRLVKHIEKDHDFKRVVVLEKEREVILLGGNHRTAAFAKAEKKVIGVYLVRSDDEAKLTLLSHQLNLDIGEETESEGLLAQAVDMVTRFGMSVTEASQKYLVPGPSIRSQLQAMEIRKRADALGVNVRAASNLTLERLYQFRDEEPVLKRVLIAVRDQKLHGEKLEDVVRIVKKEKSEASRLAAVDRYITNVLGTRVTSPKGRSSLGPKARLKSLASQMLNLISDKTARNLGFTSPTEDHEAMVLFGKLGEKLVRMSKERIGEY